MATAGVHHSLPFCSLRPLCPSLLPRLAFQVHRFSNVYVSIPRVATIVNESRRKPSPYEFKAVCRSKGNSRKEEAFLDQNGVVQDMDAYLDSLSLEYDSVWDTKPSWCQPWTIVVTGILAITASWIVLHSGLVTAVVITLISAWWYIFLYSYPKVYAEMIAARKERVTNGLEDTFGERKGQ
ncbi:unnamed protein product [Cuscuta europaea]|uniref:DUF6737 domain-containing protein n=1 Tax=Cuscuta europaea TaxID=41803 RepID=A0A9P0ZUE7_CUSEU|nr:unnamed protein product [Cuscuta europaea]